MHATICRNLHGVPRVCAQLKKRKTAPNYMLVTVVYQDIRKYRIGAADDRSISSGLYTALNYC